MVSSNSSLRLGEVLQEEWATGDPRQGAGKAGFLGLTAEPTRQGLTMSPVVGCLSVSVTARGKAATETMLELGLQVRGAGRGQRVDEGRVILNILACLLKTKQNNQKTPFRQTLPYPTLFPSC